MKKIVKITVFLIFLIIAGYIGIYVIARLTPKLSINSANSFFLYDKNNKIYNGNNEEWIKLNKISDNLINATIAIEDKNFYHHQGFDYPRILKAMYNNITNRKIVEGASTISQQYAKNLFLNFDKNFARKLQEAWLTMRLEVHYSKKQILEGYLNTINYGGIFGIENASKYYFDKSSKDLTLAEAAILAGIPKDPTNYSPISNYDNAKKRQELILYQMYKNKMISKKDMNKAIKEKLTLTGDKKRNNLKTLMYYQDAVINELKNIKSVPNSFLETGGLKIYTNLDPKAQKTLEDSIDKNLNDNQKLEIAGIMVKPKTGKIIALTGGRDYSKSQYNRAINAKRQVGSTIKPFLYYSALENGFTPSTTFTSEKTTFTFSENKTYSPTNYGESYANKEISLAAAITYSDNIYAVKTHLFLGEDNLIDIVKRVGISTKLDNLPSMALGTKEINLMDMIKGYTTLANEGFKTKPYLITKVTDANGNTLYRHKNREENVLNKSIVYVLNSMLRKSYSTEFIDYAYPTCINLANKLTKDYAIKTGTTNNDHLIFGYNKEVLLGMWAGYDDNRESDLTDGTKMKLAWADTVEEYLKDKDNSWYKMPNNVVGVLVNPITGKLSNNSDSKKTMLYYIKGTEPINNIDNSKDKNTVN